MTRPDLRPLIKRHATDAAAKYGAPLADVLGTGTSRECIFARREAIRAVLAESSCSYRALANAWGIDPQMIQRAIQDADTLRPFSITTSAATWAATEAKLLWQYGPERAAAIKAGRDPETQADLARWRNLGKRGAA